jgi:hypothetical protein
MVMILLLIAHLGLLYSHRALLFEQRASAGQVRAVRAQEAAQAGIDWAVSRLNDRRATDPRCQPTSQGSDPLPATLRARWERSLATPTPLQPACVQSDPDPVWYCDCPDDGPGRVAAPDNDTDHPAFALTLDSGPRAGLWTLTAEGCSRPGPDCGTAAGHVEPDGRYRVTAVLAPLGQVLSPPLAALTSAGAVGLSGGARVLNTDHASGGITVHGGGDITLQAPATAIGPPGQPVNAGLIASDPSLTAPLWQGLFGLEVSALRALPSWEPLACGGGCTGADLDAAVQRGARALWLDGDLRLAGGRWGLVEAPLLVVVRGTLQLGADVSLQGLVIADRVQAQAPAAASPRSQLRGALVSLGATTLDGAIDVVRDAAVLQRAATLGGVLAPVPGSWFDPHTR